MLEDEQIKTMDRSAIPMPYYGRHFLLQEIALRHPHQLLKMMGRIDLGPSPLLTRRGAFVAKAIPKPLGDDVPRRTVVLDTLDEIESLINPEKTSHESQENPLKELLPSIDINAFLPPALRVNPHLQEEVLSVEYAEIDRHSRLWKAMKWDGALANKWLPMTRPGKTGWFSDEPNARAFGNAKKGYNIFKKFGPKSTLKLFHLMDNGNLFLLAAEILARGISYNQMAEALQDLGVVQITTGFLVTWEEQLAMAMSGRWGRSCQDRAVFSRCRGGDGNCHDGFVVTREDLDATVDEEGSFIDDEVEDPRAAETEEVKLITITRAGAEGGEDRWKETTWGPRQHDLNRLSTNDLDGELARVIRNYLGEKTKYGYRGYFAGVAPSLDVSLAGTWPAEHAQRGKVGMNFIPQEICLFSMADVEEDTSP